MERRIEFLYSAIADAQELIRFIDNKTAFVVTILGAYVILIFSLLDNLCRFASSYSAVFWWFFLAFILALILCIIVTIRIIKPTNNPLNNVKFDGEEKPRLKFFLPLNKYSENPLYAFFNSDTFKLDESYRDYLKVITESESVDIVRSLSLELFKVSFIRNVKNGRFNTLLILLIITTCTFLIFFICYLIETDQLIHCVSPH